YYVLYDGCGSIYMYIFFVFFFSSRRRHTRSKRDWSSDVCSSDLLNLTFDELDSIVTQGKKLGTYMYIFTGGEPMVRKKDIIALCEKHSDCEFLSFTNGTLIDEDF